MADGLPPMTSVSLIWLLGLRLGQDSRAGYALIGLSMLGDLPWWVTVVIMVREVGITALRFAVLRRGVIPASRGGKLKTLVQAVAIGLFVLPLSGAWLTGAWVVMWAAVVLTVLTGVDYVVSAVRDSRGRPAGH